MTSFTVTATQGGVTAGGIAIQLLVREGQLVSFLGATAGVTSATPSVSITPQASGSTVYGVTTALTGGAPTPLAGTTNLMNDSGGGLFYEASQSTGTVSGTPITQGYSGVTGIATVAMEVKGTIAAIDAATGQSGTLTSATTGTFNAGPGALLVAMVGSNGGAGITTMTITDTSGLGLSWVEQVKQNTSGNGYAGVWTAVVPGNVYSLFGQVVNGQPGLAADNQPYTMGVRFSVTQTASLTGIWFYSASGTGVTLPSEILLFNDDTHALIHSETGLTWSGAAGSGWVRAPFASPPSLATGTNYRACIYDGATNPFYAATAHYWDTGSGGSGITNGPIVAPNSAGAGTSGQDSFLQSATPGYPNTSFNASNYWVDVEVSTGGPAPGPPALPGPGLLMAVYP